jgi:hypothetical protein
LHDAVHRQRRTGRQRPLLALHGQLDRQPGVLHATGQRPELLDPRLGDPAAREVVLAQHVQQAPHLGQCVAPDGRDGVHCLARTGRVHLHQPLRRGRLHDHDRHAVRHHVVQLARDAAALEHDRKAGVVLALALQQLGSRLECGHVRASGADRDAHGPRQNQGEEVDQEVADEDVERKTTVARDADEAEGHADDVDSGGNDRFAQRHVGGDGVDRDQDAEPAHRLRISEPGVRDRAKSDDGVDDHRPAPADGERYRLHHEQCDGADRDRRALGRGHAARDED